MYANELLEGPPAIQCLLDLADDARRVAMMAHRERVTFFARGDDRWSRLTAPLHGPHGLIEGLRQHATGMVALRDIGEAADNIDAMLWSAAYHGSCRDALAIIIAFGADPTHCRVEGDGGGVSVLHALVGGADGESGASATTPPSLLALGLRHRCHHHY